ncbi:MAG TPA: glycosyltransferase family 2 protein [Pyrinomonadaceae bacterium]
MRDALPDSAIITPQTKSVFVVVPSHNHARFVEKCLRSIIKQTLSPTELLVIDDGSADNSPSIIEQTLKNCPFPSELVVRENRGLPATLNEALNRSHGDFFAYLGSDDLWLPSFLETRSRTLASQPNAVLTYGNAFSIDETDRIIDCTIDWAAYVDGDARRMLMTTLAPLSPSVVYRRQAVERYCWNENSALEDYELYLRLSGEGDFAFEPQVLSAWRVHGQNASLDISMMNREKINAQLRVGPYLGFNAEELRRFQSVAMFRSAQEYMRRSERKQAIKLMMNNIRGVTSSAAAVRMMLGLVMPQSLLRRRRALREKRATRKYGSVVL